MRKITALVLASFLWPLGALQAKRYSSRVSSHHSHSYTSSRHSRHSRIKRSTAAKVAFKRQHPCPSTGKSPGPCRGYVIDHVKPLACGGADDPSNMQWQTVEEGKAKDKWERKGCK
jgi:hypothetical protein